MTLSCLGYHFLKDDHFVICLSKCNDHMKMSCPQKCLMQNSYWICRHECNPKRCEWRSLFLFCKCPSCECKCECICMWCKYLLLECLVQKSLSNMQTWMQPYDGATENFLWCKCLPGRCICKLPVLWDIVIFNESFEDS